MAAAGVTSSTADTMTTTAELLDHAKAIAVMRAKAVESSCEEYLACKFLLLSNGERYKPLRTHLENGHAEGKRPYPTTVEGMKTLMVDSTGRQEWRHQEQQGRMTTTKGLPSPRPRSGMG